MLCTALMLANPVLFWLTGLSPRYRGSHTNQQLMLCHRLRNSRLTEAAQLRHAGTMTA